MIHSKQGVRPLQRACPHNSTRKCSVRSSLKQQPSSIKHAQLPEGATLTNWIREEGGFIHDSLRVVSEAPCGVRGVVCCERVDAEEEGLLGLVCVPERLYMTSTSGKHAVSYQ